MPKAIEKKSKTQLLKEAKARAARLKRGQTAIRKVLEDEDLSLSAPNVRVFFSQEGRLSAGGDVMSFDTLARMCKLPDNTVLMPQITIRPREQATNGQ